MPVNIDSYGRNKPNNKTKRVLAFRTSPEVIADFIRRKELLGLKEDTELLAEIYQDGLEPAFERLLKIKADEAQHTLQTLKEHSAQIKQTARRALAQPQKPRKAQNA